MYASFTGFIEWRWRMPPPAVLPSEMLAIANDAVKADHRDARKGHLICQGGAVVSIQCSTPSNMCHVLILNLARCCKCSERVVADASKCTCEVPEYIML